VTETFIGGFASGFMGQGFMGMRVGYGLYFTTTRLFGVYAANWSGGSLGGKVAGLIEGELMPVLSPEQNATVIAELERAKQYELAKDQIRTIELKKPGLWGMGLGRATIRPINGPSISYTLRSVIAYDRLVQLTQAFGQELVSK
jgi:hypothetical protein